MKNTQELMEKIVENIERVIVGKRRVVELAVISLLSQGHLLIEDVPGVGKTMLARSLALSIGSSFGRIQFTPDMLPSDVTGVSVYSQATQKFEFRPGPIMADIVLVGANLSAFSIHVAASMTRPEEARNLARRAIPSTSSPCDSSHFS